MTTVVIIRSCQSTDILCARNARCLPSVARGYQLRTNFQLSILQFSFNDSILKLKNRQAENEFENLALKIEWKLVIVN